LRQSKSSAWKCCFIAGCINAAITVRFGNEPAKQNHDLTDGFLTYIKQIAEARCEDSGWLP